MLIGMDNFGSTHSKENKELCDRMYLTHRKAGYIDKRSVRQAYDETAKMFLPDRYVKGICPVCEKPDQYGDSCENCGSTYTPADLKSPGSVVSGTAPVWRESEHFFFRLSAFETFLSAWVGSGAVQDSVARKLDEWFSQGLRDWDISRDAPYFGFEIPDAPGKYFYVWFDAPIGYLASFTQLCARSGLKFDDFFAADSSAELHHFIGKDILYFHTLFWPAVLQASKMRSPTAVHVHGFLTVNAQKMSKSRGTFITARKYLENFPAEYLRYYFAAKLGPGIDDMDMNLGRVRHSPEFGDRRQAREYREPLRRFHNADLGRQVGENPCRSRSYMRHSSAPARVSRRTTTAAIRRPPSATSWRFAIAPISTSIRANLGCSPRTPKNAAEVQNVCTQALNLFRILMIYLEPVLPKHGRTRASLLPGVGLDAGPRQRRRCSPLPSMHTKRWRSGWIRKPWRGWSSPRRLLLPLRQRRGGASQRRRLGCRDIGSGSIGRRQSDFNR